MQAAIEMCVILGDVTDYEMANFQAEELKRFLERRALSNKDAVFVNGVDLLSDDMQVYVPGGN